MNKYILILLSILIIFIIITSYIIIQNITIIESQNKIISLDKKNINELKLEISNSKTKIIGLQDNDRYLRKQKENVVKQNSDLQEVYNNIALDWQYCVIANFCLNYSDDCVVYVEDNFGVSGFTSVELHEEFSGWCEESSFSWDKYSGFFTGKR